MRSPSRRRRRVGGAVGARQRGVRRRGILRAGVCDLDGAASGKGRGGALRLGVPPVKRSRVRVGREGADQAGFAVGFAEQCQCTWLHGGCEFGDLRRLDRSRRVEASMRASSAPRRSAQNSEAVRARMQQSPHSSLPIAARPGNGKPIDNTRHVPAADTPTRRVRAESSVNATTPPAEAERPERSAQVVGSRHATNYRPPRNPRKTLLMLPGRCGAAEGGRLGRRRRDRTEVRSF